MSEARVVQAHRDSLFAALFIVVATQTYASFLTRVLPTLAPALLPAAGLPTHWVGRFSALSSLGTIVVLIFGTAFIKRIGSSTSLQLGLMLGSIGSFMLMVASVPTLAIGCAFLGIASAPCYSAGNDILQRIAPPGRRNLLFSIKQAGVPLGGVIAGLCLPALVATVGSSWTTAIAAGAGVLLAAAIVVRRDALATSPVSGRLMVPRSPLRLLLSAVPIRRLGIAAFLLAISQGLWFTYLVTVLVERLGWTLTHAGGAYALMLFVTAVIRPIIGMVADATQSSIGILCLQSVVGAASAIAFAMIDGDTPMAWIALLVVVAAASACAWNGLHAAAVADACEPHEVAEASACIAIVTFAGLATAPLLVELLGSPGARIDPGFVACGIATLAASGVLRLMPRGVSSP